METLELISGIGLRPGAMQLFLQPGMPFFGEIVQQVFTLVPLATLNEHLSAKDLAHSFAEALRAVQAEEQAVADLQPWRSSCLNKAQ